MKKFLTLVLCAAMVLTLVACGSKSGGGNKEGDTMDLTAMVDKLEGMTEEGISRVLYLATASEMIAEADMVCFIEGWRNSDAAQLERSICTYLDKKVKYFI